MKTAKKLVHDTFLYAIAHFSAAVLNFALLPIYTSYFSPKQFGTWDLLLTTATLLVPFITFELTAATYRWLIDTSSKDKQKTIISTGFFQIVQHTIIVNVIAIIIFSFISFTYQWEAIVFINVTIFNQFLQQCTRGLQRNKLFAGHSVIQAIGIFLLNIIFIVFFNMGIKAIFYAHIVAGLITFIIVSMKLRFSQYLAGSFFSKRLLKQYLAYATPMIPATASWWMMTMADRWIIAYFLGLAQNGIYAIAIKIPAVLLLLNSVFSLAWKDSAITTFEQREKNAFYTTVFKHYFRFMATTVICLILLAKPIIAIFLGAAYFTAWQYTAPLLIATLFHAFALFWSAGFHGAKETRALLTTTVIGAVVNIALNIAFAPLFGLYGIAVATAIAFFITWGLRIRLARKYFYIQMKKRDVLFFSVLIIVSFVITTIGNNVLLFMSIVGSIALFIAVNRKLVTGMAYLRR